MAPIALLEPLFAKVKLVDWLRSNSHASAVVGSMLSPASVIHRRISESSETLLLFTPIDVVPSVLPYEIVTESLPYATDALPLNST